MVVREGDNGVAYLWNLKERKWDKIGEVVDGPDDRMKRPVLNRVQYDYAGNVGQTVAYPLDVIQRRMQMGGWKDASSVVTGDGKAAIQYTGMVDAFWKTVR